MKRSEAVFVGRVGTDAALEQVAHWTNGTQGNHLLVLQERSFHVCVRVCRRAVPRAGQLNTYETRVLERRRQRKSIPEAWRCTRLLTRAIAHCTCTRTARHAFRSNASVWASTRNQSTRTQKPTPTTPSPTRSRHAVYETAAISALSWLILVLILIKCHFEHAPRAQRRVPRMLFWFSL